MRCKIYITDEGYGPIVRQKAIVEELKLLKPSLSFTIQTEVHIEELKRIFQGVDYVKKYNLISWFKNPDGTPGVEEIKKTYENYLSLSDEFLKSEPENVGDFVISDFVYEAFEIAYRRKIPSFGVAHFTWDWFFSKLYPPPLKTNVLQSFFEYAEKADILFFPPFTPPEILNHYKKKAKQVPLIVRHNINHKPVLANSKFKVLIIDSGAGVLGQSIGKAFNTFAQLSDFHFFASSAFKTSETEHSNISFIDKNEFFIDYIPEMDLVIGRAGFNTISECIAYRTPMLLIGEAMNPEMNENIVNIKKAGLGSFISVEDFTESIRVFLPRFIKHEYKVILENMQSHEYRTDGARVVAEDILNLLNK